jgi:hypothetical protein
MLGLYAWADRLRAFMKIKLDRIISIATLLASIVAIVLVLKRPAPLAQPQTPAAIAANVQSFGQKMDQLEQAAQQAPPAAVETAQTSPSQSQQIVSSGTQSTAQTSAQPKAEVHLNSDEVGAALAQALGTAGAGSLSADSNLGGGEPTIKDQHVSFDGDVVHGQFLTEIAGKDVWITVSGHLASKDGYATFEPTEFKVGDLSVPVSLVNPALQKKLAEQRDRMKLPDFVGDVKVQNGELVMQQK